MEQYPFYFNTVNKTKVAEIKEIFKGKTGQLKFLCFDVMEVLSEKIEIVIKAKAIEAYKQCRVPIVVEHGGLIIDYFNGFPGALSKPMWDLMNDRICELIPHEESRSAIAISAVCFCDGINSHIFKAETKGSISSEGRGVNGFQWDPIFIPDGAVKTYAEMSQTEKLKFSQAAKAYNLFIEFWRNK